MLISATHLINRQTILCFTKRCFLFYNSLFKKNLTQEIIIRVYCFITLRIIKVPETF